MDLFWLIVTATGTGVFWFGWWTLGDEIDQYYKKEYQAKNTFRKYVNARYAFTLFAPWIYFKDKYVSKGWWIFIAFDICLGLGFVFFFAMLEILGIVSF